MTREPSSSFQIKEMHVDDRGQGHDEMESENQKPQNPPVEDVASPMIRYPFINT